MTAALKIQGLSKKFEGFALDKVSFQVPSGSIVGLIGENGAGKTTTINAALGLIKKDSGEIELFGENVEHLTPSIKEEIGAVFDASNFSEELTPEKLDKVLKDIYTSWDQDLFRQLLDRLEIPFSRKIKTFSKGMKMKLSLAAALSHHPKLLILDEATCGLDPVMRDDILDMFLEFAPIERNHFVSITGKDAQNEKNREILERLLKIFPAETAQALEYFLDVSLFCQWQREKAGPLQIDEKRLNADVAYYSSLGIKNISTFAAFMDCEWLQRYGTNAIETYGKIVNETE